MNKTTVKLLFFLLSITHICFGMDKDSLFDILDQETFCLYKNDPLFLYKTVGSLFFKKEKISNSQEIIEENTQAPAQSQNARENNNVVQNEQEKAEQEYRKQQELQFGTERERKKIKKEQERRKQPSAEKKGLGLATKALIGVAISIVVVPCVIAYGLSWLTGKGIKDLFGNNK